MYEDVSIALRNKNDVVGVNEEFDKLMAKSFYNYYIEDMPEYTTTDLDSEFKVNYLIDIWDIYNQIYGLICIKTINFISHLSSGSFFKFYPLPLDTFLSEFTYLLAIHYFPEFKDKICTWFHRPVQQD